MILEGYESGSSSLAASVRITPGDEQECVRNCEANVK